MKKSVLPTLLVASILYIAMLKAQSVPESSDERGVLWIIVVIMVLSAIATYFIKRARDRYLKNAAIQKTVGKTSPKAQSAQTKSGIKVFIVALVFVLMLMIAPGFAIFVGIIALVVYILSKKKSGEKFPQLLQQLFAAFKPKNAPIDKTPYGAKPLILHGVRIAEKRVQRNNNLDVFAANLSSLTADDEDFLWGIEIFAKTIETVDLSSNMFKKINLAPLIVCKKLNRLNLSNNLLETIDYATLAALDTITHLNLSSNLLKSFDFNILGEMESLIELDISSNDFDATTLENLANAVHKFEKVHIIFHK